MHNFKTDASGYSRVFGNFRVAPVEHASHAPAEQVGGRHAIDGTVQELFVAERRFPVLLLTGPIVVDGDVVFAELS